ncbi:MAG: hypothetical protein R3218_00870 [Christiangramia sp.]|nr:hypothetical protein [Christiangramia sp.]
MHISYENDEIRECCLLLGPAAVNSSFTTDEIKELRAFIADLKAAPKLTDAPIKYDMDINEGFVRINYNSFKIICKIISSYKRPTINQIERLKVVQIQKVGLQVDVTKKNKNKFK